MTGGHSVLLFIFSASPLKNGAEEVTSFSSETMLEHNDDAGEEIAST